MGVNMGIGIVAPAVKILETINQPELAEMRRKIEEQERKKIPLPTMDSVGSYDKFAALAGKVLSVSRDEMLSREAKFKADKPNRPKRGPKPRP